MNGRLLQRLSLLVLLLAGRAAAQQSPPVTFQNNGVTACGSYTANFVSGATVTCSNGRANITITGGGSGVTSVTASSPIASSGGTTPNISLSGIVPIANGGTNATSVGSSGCVWASTGTSYVCSNVGTSGQILHSGGIGVPTWSAVDLTSTAQVSGVLPLTNGGTGNASGISTYQTTWLSSVVSADGSDINLSAPGAVIGGATMSTGDSFLAAGQADATQNGVYVWNGPATLATRRADASTSAQFDRGQVIFVTSGTLAGMTFLLTTPPPITLGVSSPVYDSYPQLGGDVTGSASSTTVIRINGSPLGTTTGASQGSALVWNGASWSPSLLPAGAWGAQVFGLSASGQTLTGAYLSQGETFKTISGSWGQAGSGTGNVVLSVLDADNGNAEACSCTIGACNAAANTPLSCACGAISTSNHKYVVQVKNTSSCSVTYPSNVVVNVGMEFHL